MHNNMKFFRIEKGLSLKDLGIKTNLSAGYLSHLENGSRNNPSYKVMNKIANALGKKITDIF